MALTFADFRTHMLAEVPRISEDEIRQQYLKLIQSGEIEPSYKDSLYRGLAGIGEGVIGLGQYLGFIPEDAKVTRRAEEFPSPYEGRSILDEPGMLLDPGFWGHGLTEMAPQVPFWGLGMMAGGPAAGMAVGGLTSGLLESMPEFSQSLEQGMDPTEARIRGGLSTLGVGALGGLAFGQALQKTSGLGGALKNMLKTGLAEGTTEVLEEPVQALAWGRDPMEALVQGANVFPLSFLTGGLMGGMGSGVNALRQPATNQTLPTMEQVLATAPTGEAVQPVVTQQIEESIKPLLNEQGEIVLKPGMRPPPEAMRELVTYADQTGKTIRATPEAKQSPLFKKLGFMKPVDPVTNEPMNTGEMVRPSPEVLPMQVYHGSPHKFDRVDLSKVGTGEGAQAYGHGFYAAESQDVGKIYQQGIGNMKVTERMGKALDELDRLGYDSRVEALRDIRRTPNWRQQWDVTDNHKAADIIDEEISKQAGNLYELDLPDETIGRMLDYDKDLVEQPEIVKKILKKFADDFRGEGIYDNVIDIIDQPQVFDAQSLYQAMIYAEGNPEKASRSLNAMGIPGIKYLDQASRDKGQGTRNFVVFDENAITPLTRNGVPINRPEVLKSVNRQTLTPAFKNWFGDSKVVDENGDPLVVYHGTTQGDIAEFDLDKITEGNEYGKGFYFTSDKNEASRYAEKSFDRSAWGQKKKFGDERAVYPVYIKMDNPLDLKEEIKLIDDTGDLTKQGEQIIDWAEKNTEYGYEYTAEDLYDIIGAWHEKDGTPSTSLTAEDLHATLTEKYPDDDLWLDYFTKRNRHDGLVIGDEYIVFNPTQIKSAIGNQGTFDPNNPNILKQQSPAGKPTVALSGPKTDSLTHEYPKGDVEVLATKNASQYQVIHRSAGLEQTGIPDPGVVDLVSSIFGDLRYNGMPHKVFQQVGNLFVFDGLPVETNAVYVSSGGSGMKPSLGINRAILSHDGHLNPTNDPQLFRQTIAHELGHLVDYEFAPFGAPISQTHSDFKLNPAGIGLAFDTTGKRDGHISIQKGAVGPIFEEALRYFDTHDTQSDTVARFLAYPLADVGHIAVYGVDVETGFGTEKMSLELAKADEGLQMQIQQRLGGEMRRMQTELFAQLWSAYHTAPEQLKTALPKGYRFIEKLTEATREGRTISDSRQSVRRAIWANRAEYRPGVRAYPFRNAPPAGFRTSAQGGNEAVRGQPATERGGPVARFSTTPEGAVEEERIGNLSPRGVVGGDLTKEERDITRQVSDMLGKERRRAARGKISLPELDIMAQALDMDPQELARRAIGSTWNAEHIRAAAEIVKKRSRDLKKMADQALIGGVEEKAQFLDAYNALSEVLIPFQGIAAEAGRALGAFRGATKGMSPRELADVMTDPSIDVDAKARRIADLPTDAAVAKQVGKEMTPTWIDKLLELWINGLLSGPQTQVVNLVSNGLVDGFSTVEHAGAALVSALRRDKSVPWGSVAARTQAMATSGIKAAQAATKAFRYEEEFGQSPIERRYPKAIKGTKGKVVRIPGRALTAGDAFYKVIAMRGALADIYYRDGKQQGLKGKELHRYIQDGIEKPSDQNYTRAMDEADYFTFTRKLGKFGSTMQKLAMDHPALKIVFPFIRTPMNIVKFAAERTPFGLAMKEVRENLTGKNGRHQQNLQISRLAVGSSVMMGIASLAAQGLVSGGGPSDPKEKALLYQQGWMPYSIKIGDTWYAYGRLEPLGMLFGIAADMHEIGLAAVSPEDAEKIGSMIVGAISKNLTSKTFLRGLSELINAATDPDRYGERYVQNLFSTVIPTLSAQIARTDDPTLRRVNDMAQAIMGRIPGQREKLAPIVDRYGQPITREGGVGPDILSPIYTSRVKDDPVAAELYRLDYTGGMAGKEVFGVELTDLQRNEYQRLLGETTRQILERLIGSTAWERMSDDVKRDIIDRIYDRVRRQVKPVVLAGALRDRQ